MNGNSDLSRNRPRPIKDVADALLRKADGLCQLGLAPSHFHGVFQKFLGPVHMPEILVF
jgi:hypothetical protein